MSDLDDLMAPGELRALVREVLREVLPTLPVPPADAQARPAMAPQPSAGRTLPKPTSGSGPAGPALASPALVSPALAGPAPTGRASANLTQSGQNQSGRDQSGSGVERVTLTTDAELHGFVLHLIKLADNPKRRADILAGKLRFALAGTGGASPAAPVQRIDKGAVTERTVIAAAKTGTRLVLGPRAVLTPLAKDKARALGVRVEKER